jgi:hypothetical protein
MEEQEELEGTDEIKDRADRYCLEGDVVKRCRPGARSLEQYGRGLRLARI